MTPAELARVRRCLVAFATEVFEPLARADQRRWGEVYLRGLMLDGKRKSIQPVAERLPDGNEQALQQFISQSLSGDSRIRSMALEPSTIGLTAASAAPGIGTSLVTFGSDE